MPRSGQPSSGFSETRVRGARSVLIFSHSAEVGHAKALHSHPEGQLYVIHSGLVVVEVEGTTWIMPQGRMGWIPPGALHGAALHRSSAPGVVGGFTIYLAPE